jgi:(p)ppGpp synthase/HD superfamily hydrolase
MQGLDPTEPTKEALQEVICKVFSHLRLREAERLFLLLAFNISFDGHNLTPRRASGEIYFLHVFRQFICAAFLMSRHQVLSIKMLAAILLHGTVEDATKAGSTRLLAKTTIHLILQDEDVEYMVMCLTKKASPKEERRAYLKRVLSVDVWEVLELNPLTQTITSSPYRRCQRKSSWRKSLK